MKKIIALILTLNMALFAYDSYIKHEKKCIDGQKFILTSVFEKRTYNDMPISANLVQVFVWNTLEVKTMPKECK